MRIDLHSHTTCSDGTFTPSALVQEAARREVGVLAVTDHDTVAALAEAQAEGKRVGVRVIWGVELSARDSAGEVHILSYFRAEPPEAFRALLERQRLQRVERAGAMLQALEKVGITITLAELRAAGASDHSIGRPHVARVLLSRGYVTTFSEAFRKFLGPGCPGYVPQQVPDPAEAVALVRGAGGVAGLAHPGHLKDPATLDRAAEAGLQALEVYHPDHKGDRVAFYEAQALTRGLISLGGSDFHGAGGSRAAKLGDHPTPPGSLVRLEAAWG